MKRVAIIHPWFPQYRAGFFEKLIALGDRKNIRVDIFHGEVPPEWKERGDSTTAPYATALKTRFFRIGRRNLGLKDLKPLHRNNPYDLVVVEQAVRNLETYQLLLGRNATPLAFWGHGSTVTQQVGAVQERVKQWITSKGSWFFAYTAGGARAVEAGGFRPERVTVVRNSIDTKILGDDITAVTRRQRKEFETRHQLTGSVGLFIGGLDDSKRLPFLLEAAEKVHEAQPHFKLLIAGKGPLNGYVEKYAAARDWIAYLGPLSGGEKAIAMASSAVLLMPGRVGLVAVDSFTAGLPIVTTDWPWHAPEFEYLDADRNAVVTDDDVDSYVAGVLALLDSPEKLDRLRRACLGSAPEFSTDQMAANFMDGIQNALSATDAR